MKTVSTVLGMFKYPVIGYEKCSASSGLFTGYKILKD